MLLDKKLSVLPDDLFKKIEQFPPKAQHFSLLQLWEMRTPLEAEIAKHYGLYPLRLRRQTSEYYKNSHKGHLIGRLHYKQQTGDDSLQRLSSYLASVFFQLPSLTEKSRGCDTARRACRSGCAQINHRPIWQLRRLARVTRMMRLAEGEPAIDHDVTFWVERVRIDQDRRV